MARAAVGNRAGLIAAISIVNYLAFGLPALIAGMATSHFGLHDTALAYSAGIALLAAAAAGGFLFEGSGRTRAPRAAAPPPELPLPTPGSRNFAARRGTGPRADENRPFVEFKEDWFMSCLNAVRPRFEGLLRQTALVIRAHPQLAQTVCAYAECRYSVRAYARQLHIHPKGGRYRLDRWRTLTGWNVETFNGLMASLIA